MKERVQRETLTLEAYRFTSMSALAREITALMENSTYKLEIALTAKQLEELTPEMEAVKTLGRVKLVQL